MEKQHLNLDIGDFVPVPVFGDLTEAEKVIGEFESQTRDLVKTFNDELHIICSRLGVAPLIKTVDGTVVLGCAIDEPQFTEGQKQ